MKSAFGALWRCCAVSTLLASTSLAFAGACRVTDFSDMTLSSLNEVQRLSLVTEMTQTEFDRLHQARPGDSNYYPLIVDSDSVSAARREAWSKLESLGLENFDDYRRIWASDFLNAEQSTEYADCISGRQPGLTVVGGPEDPAHFRITLAHITPVGIEKITTRLVASHNVANIDDFEKFLADIGPQDNYTARTFVLEKADPTKRAVLVIRAGWETPDFVYIPVYPTPDYFKQ